MSASEKRKVQQRPDVVTGVSMRELLAAGVAARVISTPPSAAARGPVGPPAGQGKPKAA